MISSVQIGGVRITGSATKKIISTLLLLTALGAIVATYFLGQEQITRAAEIAQKIKFIKAGNEVLGTVRRALDAPREPLPAYFSGMNRSYKQLEKFLGNDALDPNQEKLVNDKLKSEQHLRARLIVIRDNVKELLSKEKQVIVLAAGFEAFTNFSSAGGMLDIGRIRTDSPVRKTGELLNTIGNSGTAWLNNPLDNENFANLQKNLNLLTEQRSMLDSMAASDKLSARQLEIYKAIRKIPLWTKSTESVDALNQFNVIRAKLLDLTKDRDSVNSLIGSMELELNNSDSEQLVNALKILAVVCIVAAIVVNLLIGSNFNFGDLSGRASTPEQMAALKETQDILPYTQIAIRQIVELGGRVLNATKRFHTIINDENFADRRKVVESNLPEQVAEFDLHRLQSEITALREQALQLTLSNSGNQNPISMPEYSMRLNKIVDSMDSSLHSLQQSIIDAFQKKQNIESNDLRNISRESEGLIVALSQLDRQIVRMEGVLGEMDLALQGAIQKGFSSSTKDELGGHRADVFQ